jgi:hypothetical protein
MAGYSGTPLVQKLGLKPGDRVRLLDAPPEFRSLLAPVPERVVWEKTLRAPLDFVVLFAPNRAALVRGFARAARSLSPAGMLWVAWPKAAAKVPTDLNENVVREHGLAAGLVDVKVCAITEVWSGLKFVRRLADR